MKVKFRVVLIVLTIILIPMFALKADNSDKKSTIFVASDETVSGNLIAASESVIIDGLVSGDLIVAANHISVTGRVEGDIIAVGQEITIDGEVGGNIRVAANSVTINGSITRNLNILGSKVLIGEDARIGWDALVAAVDSTIRGNITGSLDTYAKNNFIAGKIGKNANIRAYNVNDSGIIIDKDATVNGNFTYSARNEFDLNNTSGISGEISFNQLKNEARSPASSWLWGRVFTLLSLLFIGLIFVAIIPKFTNQFLLEAKNRTISTFLFGAGIFLLLPPLAIITALTIIGLPLALILSTLWIAGIFIGKAVAAIIIGDVVIKNILKKNYRHIFWPLLLGVILFTLLFSIPWFGWIVNLIAIWLGLGSILSYVANKPKDI